MASNRLNRDYIHYRYVNYLRFGVKYPEHKTQNTANIYNFKSKRNEFINNIRRQKKVTLDRKTIKQFEQYYENILNPELAGKNSEYFQQVNNLLQQAVNRKLERDLNSKHITSTGSVALTLEEQEEQKQKYALGLKSKMLNSLKLDNNKTGVTAKKLENSLNQTYNLAKQYLERMDPNNINAQQVRQQVQAIEQLINNAIRETQTAISGVDSEIQKSFSLYIQSLKRTSQGYIDKDSSIINQINELIQLLKAPNVSFFGGVGGEYTVAVTQAVIESKTGNLTEKKIKEIVDKALTGQISEKTGNLKKAQDLNSLFGFKDSSGVEMNIHESESSMKVDIKIPNNKGKDVGISIKNYNLKKGRNLNLIEGAPFTSMLMEEPSFASHYLNIASVRENGESSIKSSKKSINIDGYKDYSTVVKEANQGLKMILLLASLRGASGRNQASYLLINDNSRNDRGSVKLINIYDLMDIILQDDSGEYLSNAVKITLDHQKITDNLTKGLFNNNWIGEKYVANRGQAIDRVSGILAEAHKKKISVAIKPNVIKTFF